MIRFPIVTLFALVLLQQVAIAQVSEKLPTSTGKDQTYTGNVPNFSLDTTPDVQWKYTSTGNNFWQVRAFGKTVIGVDRKGTLHALDTETGRALWKFQSGSFISDLCFTADDNDAVIFTNEKGIYSVSRKTGRLHWASKVASGFGGPTIAGTSVFAAGNDGIARAYDSTTGRKLWEHDFIVDRPKDPPGFDGKRGRGGDDAARPRSASTDGKTFFFPVFDQCRVVAVDVKTGKRKWAFQTKGWIYARPTIHNGRVFIGSQDKKFYCINKETGKLVWEVGTKSRIEAPGATSKNIVVIGSCDGVVRCISTEMSNEIWNFKLEKVMGRTSAIYCQPIISRTLVYVASMEGQIYAIDRKTGKLKWKIRPSDGSEINGQPQVEGNRMFISTRLDDGNGESSIMAIGFDK